MSVEHGPAFVAVVGPPGGGKSTITGALADRMGAQVFRLREFAYEFRAQSSVDQRLFHTSDPLGWFPEDTVAVLVRAAFLDGRFPARPMVVLENSTRVRSRRVCLTCEPDPHGDPHRPASPAAPHPDRCANCGGALTFRQSDEPQRFAARLARSASLPGR